MRRRGTVTLGAVESGALARQAWAQLRVETDGPGFVEITDAARRFVAGSGIRTGLATLFCRHTSASLTVMENADPDVLVDLGRALDGLAPRGPAYVHGSEGPDDMPAHIRTMLTDVSLTIPVADGALALGRWQGIFLVEHRDAPHVREVVLAAAGR